MLGMAYYPEQWKEKPTTEEILDDLKRFAEHGIELVRVGEFMWDQLEPEEGVYTFETLDNLFHACQKLEIQVILGTPSANPPVWLIRKYGSAILQKDDQGHTHPFGSRRHYCYNSEIYRSYVSRIVQHLATRYGNHNNLYAWQIDNEFGCEGTTYCYCEQCDRTFQQYLSKRYSQIHELNLAWGTAFWGQTYARFDQVETPKKTRALPNPHQVLDFYRFSTDSIHQFAKAQTDLIRSHSRSPITHNFMVNFTEIDYARHHELYDFISYDNYMPQTKFDPMVWAFNLDLMWSLKKRPFTVMEQQPGRVNWQQRNMYFPARWIIPAALQAYAHGADNVVFFRDRALGIGAEQYHNGLINYCNDHEQSPRLKMLPVIKERLEQLPPKVPAKVGIVFDYEAGWMNQINHVSKDFSYVQAIIDLYAALRRKGQSVEFVFHHDDLGSYDLLILPYLMHIPQPLEHKIRQFAGKLLVTCMTGIRNHHSHIRMDRPLGWQSEHLHLDIMDFGSIHPSVIEMNESLIQADYWIEELAVKKGRIAARWNQGILEGAPAIIESEDQQILYISSVPDRSGWGTLLEQWLGWKNIPSQSMIETMRFRDEQWVFHFGDKPQTLEELQVPPFSVIKHIKPES